MRIISEVPNARLAILRAAHLANVEQPEAFSSLVLDHLEPEAPRRRHGTAVRRAVLGDAHVDTAVRTTTPLTAPFQDFITRYAWGEVWSRPAISIDTRRLVTIAILVALGREQELAMHLRAASDAGVAPDELAELILHTALYCGLPAASHALAILVREIDSR
jgi:3-oxoadipate enol-lactonase/4-carboxymuconolactone decarboxylase